MLPDDERLAVARHLREFDRLGEDLAVLDKAIGEATVDDPVVRRLLTVTGISVTVVSRPRLGTFAASPRRRSL